MISDVHAQYVVVVVFCQMSSHLYLYSAFYNTDCIKAASQ